MEELHKLNNFNGMASVWLGICNSPIVQSKKSNNKIVKKATKLFNKKGNYSHYRHEIERCGVPCVPFGRVIEAYILEQMGGSESIVQVNFVNFDRCRKIGEIVMSVRNLQIGYSHLKQIKHLQEWIKKAFTTEPKPPKTPRNSVHSFDKGVVGFLQLMDSSQSNLHSSESLTMPMAQRMTFADMVFLIHLSFEIFKLLSQIAV
jgi:hypothetical protein